MAVVPDDAATRLRNTVDVLSRHFARWNQPELASAVVGILAGSDEGLPKRVLELLTQAPSGLLDTQLRKRAGEVDQQATHRRDLLINDLRTFAGECLETERHDEHK